MPLVLTDIADGVATLTLNNPDERNTLTGPMVTEIIAAMDTIEADESVGALVVTGTPPAFCAGANLGNLGTADGGSLTLDLQEDVTGFVDSIGEPVGLVGWSGSGAWVLGAAAGSDSVTAVAIYEPGVIGVGGKGDIGRLSAAMQQVGAAAADGRLYRAKREGKNRVVAYG